jgi:hypothetical protein
LQYIEPASIFAHLGALAKLSSRISLAYFRSKDEIALAVAPSGLQRNRKGNMSGRSYSHGNVDSGSRIGDN